MSASAFDRYRPETRLVHAGTVRSQFGETSEAMFLTQGYVYDSAAQAESRIRQGFRAAVMAHLFGAGRRRVCHLRRGVRKVHATT